MSIRLNAAAAAMSIRLKANGGTASLRVAQGRTGPAGPQGPQGADGAPGGSDSAFATWINDTQSQTRGALDNTYAKKGEAGGTSGSAIAYSTAKKLTGKKVVLIFRHDDMQQSQINYLDEYAARGVKASFYVTTDFLGTAGYLTAADLVTIHGAGHDIGSHSVSHPRFDTINETERRRQLSESRATIEGIIGGDYVCEVFAFPGNVDIRTELFDYYIAGLADTGTPSIHGPIDIGGHPASLADLDWVDDASLAATQTKVQNRIAALKAANPDGTAVDVIQAHNETEMSDEQLATLLDTALADPEVVVLTMGEWIHYVRENYRTIDGRFYAVGTRANPAEAAVEWNSTEASASAFASNRLGNGKAFRALVNGVEKSYLDDILVLSDGAKTSRLENGHKLQLLGTNAAENVSLWQEAGQFTIRSDNGNGVGKGTLVVRGRTWQRFNGADAFAVQTEAAATVFGVNTTRQTMRLPSLTALPTGSATVGEMCIVNGVLNICTAAGNPGTWAVVGSQT